jgi:hypothetical protein
MIIASFFPLCEGPEESQGFFGMVGTLLAGLYALINGGIG